MTLYGIDVSNYQRGLNVAAVKRQGYAFLYAKCTEGRGYADPAYPSFRDAAKDAALPFCAYHFLRSDSTPAAQAANLAAHIGDRSIPVMVDCEVSGSSRPNWSTVAAFIRECAARGIRVSQVYYPRFWWQQTGRPTFPPGTALFQAIYGANRRGYGSVIYPGDNAAAWASMGGVVPTVLQFGSQGVIDGFGGTVDVDAYRGSLAQLRASGLFKVWDNVPVIHPPAPPKPAPKPVVPTHKPTPKPAPKPVYVRVRPWPSKMSTLTGIAAAYKTSFARVRALNPQIKNPNRVYPGQRVRVR